MEFQISEFTKQIDKLKERASVALGTAGYGYRVEEEKNEVVRLVFAGQYSAGKSSIIKMLTGRTDIAIGAGITTQEAHTYEWKGLEVVDTPGIHTELRQDHDEISYDAIASADLLVFVVTNELFDSYLAEHFRKLAIEKDKAGEMILVVNKMERASSGNTPEQQDIIREDLRNVLTPYTPEQVNLCFLDAESYLDSLVERESDPEIADELVKRSGYDDFVDVLNNVVRKKKLSAKITTSLYMLDERLQKAIYDLEPKNEDEDVAALEEHLLQQRHELMSTRVQLQQAVGALFTTATAKIREIGLDAANLLVEGCKQDDVENQLEEYMRQVDQITMQCQLDADKLVETELTKMGQRLEYNERGEFAQTVMTRLTERLDTLPDSVKKMLVGAGPSLQKVGQVVADKAYKVGVDGGLKLANFSGSTIHNLILKAGHAIGHKFKPWQAIKWTRNVAIGGRILGAFGVGFSMFMQVKSDINEDKARIELQRSRQNIRSQFNEVADDFEVFAKEYIQKNVEQPLETPIREIDNNIREIRSSRKNQSELLRNLEEIQHDCQSLIHDIHQTYWTHEEEIAQ